jgi:hypothetical protein
LSPALLSPPTSEIEAGTPQGIEGFPSAFRASSSNHHLSNIHHHSHAQSLPPDRDRNVCMIIIGCV